jgi:hypothetical protein
MDVQECGNTAPAKDRMFPKMSPIASGTELEIRQKMTKDKMKTVLPTQALNGRT